MTESKREGYQYVGIWMPDDLFEWIETRRGRETPIMDRTRYILNALYSFKQVIER